MVGTLKLHFMQKNLFELFELTGSGDEKTYIYSFLLLYMILVNVN